MSDMALTLNTHRLRMERSLALRLGEGQTGALARIGPRGIGAVLAITVAASVGVAAILPSRTVTPTTTISVAGADALVYVPELLRPELAPPGPTTTPLPARYVVEEGDTLLSLSFRFGSSTESIRIASGLRDADLLGIGEQVLIPSSESLLQTIDPMVSWAEAAEGYGVEAALLTAYNGLTADVADFPINRGVIVLPGGVPETPIIRAAGSRNTAAVATANGEASTVYTVEEGDTILAIASKLGVASAAIIEANRLSNSDVIVIGAQLEVPLWSRPAVDATSGSAATATAGTAAQAPTKPSVPIVYEVAPGDTIGGLAEKFGVDTDTIVRTNELRNADSIAIGDQLTILPISGLMYTGARPLPPPPPRPSGPTNYQVQPGDTIGAIARKFGVDSADIVAANSLRSDFIGIGQSLRIVAGAAPVAGVARANTAPQQVTRNLPVPASQPSRPLAQATGGGGVVATAMRFQGSRYVFGGTTPSGFDCSGFVYYVMNNSGKSMSRGMWGQYGAGAHPSRSELQPGDIVFFQNTYMPGLSHNGIYIGNGQFIHAADERSGVKVNNLSEAYWASRWFGATRV
ncbi:MAG: hypothetical protein HW416_1205 [Chloroflexi bacterium]|nr:hypothetical protein [Chloroflexota bacterium]